MAINYTKLAATALRLISTNGRSVTLVKYSRTSSDTAQPWRDTNGIETELVTPAAFVGQDYDEILGELERRGDFAVFVPHTGEDFNEYDALVDGDRRYKIVQVREFRPGSLGVVWLLELKR